MNTLFEEFDLAGLTLSNRVVMAPMTRARAPLDVADERTALYYAQRATAGLIISEGTPISREGQGYVFNPGIFLPEQIEGWRLTTDSVRAVGGRMFAQLWHVGRISHPSIQDGHAQPVSSSCQIARGARAFGLDAHGVAGPVDCPVPRQLETGEIPRIVEQFAQAAANAMQAGFDGVEIHGANGYLLEQFMNPCVNDRMDRYSGLTLESRLQFTIEVIDAVSARIGASRVGIRLSPYGEMYDMPLHPHIDATYLSLAEAIAQRNLAYVHLMDQSKSAGGGAPRAETSELGFFGLLRDLKQLLPRTALILAGGLTRDIAQQLIEHKVIDLAAFGTPYISNPDLVSRMRHGWPLAPPTRETYYGGENRGYIDYPPYRQFNTTLAGG